MFHLFFLSIFTLYSLHVPFFVNGSKGSSSAVSLRFSPSIEKCSHLFLQETRDEKSEEKKGRWWNFTSGRVSSSDEVYKVNQLESEPDETTRFARHENSALSSLSFSLCELLRSNPGQQRKSKFIKKILFFAFSLYRTLCEDAN